MKLTVEQQIWLEQYPVFHHGLIKGQTHLPFAFTNDKERHQGLISEYLMFLVEKLDITAHVRYQALRDIRPRPCRSFGLVVEFSKRRQVAGKFEYKVEDLHLLTEVAIALFRITQESITNIATNAKPNQIKVTLNFQQHKVTFNISDNGTSLKQGWASK